jgi:hypothetical protein
MLGGRTTSGREGSRDSGAAHLSEATIARTIDIAPQPWRPLLVQAGVTTLAGVVGDMQRKTQLPDDARMRMYAALIIGRAAIEGELQAAISQARKDMAVLFKQKRIKEK